MNLPHHLRASPIVSSEPLTGVRRSRLCGRPPIQTGVSMSSASKMNSVAILVALATVCADAFPAAAQQITGAGATFPAPVYTKWGEAAQAATGIQLNYQAIGSGGGQNQIINRTVDFGASDAPVDAA